MGKLKNGWTQTTIGEVYTFVGGGTPSKSNPSFWDGNIPWASIKDISQVKVLQKTQDYITGEGLKNSAANIAEVNDVILGTRMLPGKPVIAGIRSAINQDLKIVKPKIPILPKFTFYQFEYLRNEFLSRAGGTTVQGITIDKMNEIPFLLLSLPEQKRIVAKLDTLFAHLDQLRARLDKIPVLLKQFRQAVLTQAVTGKLTHSDYHLRPLADFNIEIQTGPFGSALHKEDYVVGGIPMINPSHIFNGAIIPDTSVSIGKAKFNELKAWHLNDGDIILGRRGEMGRAAKYRAADGAMVCGTGSLILRKTSLIEPDFLSFYLRSSFSTQFLEENAVGSTMVNLNQRVIKSLPFPSIPVKEQKEIVSKVHSLFALADHTEANYDSTKEKVDRLPEAVLSKAFSGDILRSQEARSEIYLEESV